VVRTAFLAVVTTLALAAPAAAADPICRGQLAPPTPEQEFQRHIEFAMELRAENGLRADEAYVKGLATQGLPESDVIVGPVTPAEERYLKIRENLGLNARMIRYLEQRPGLSGGFSITDRFPRKPLLVIHLTRDRAKHQAALKRLAPRPRLLRTEKVRYSQRFLEQITKRIYRDHRKLRKAGFALGYVAPDPAANRVHVTVVTPRTDHARYFKRRYGPVVTELKGTEFTELVCVAAGFFRLAADGRTLRVTWIPQDSYAKPVRIEVTELGDRVELGVVERHPTAVSTDGGGPSEYTRSITLSQPLGARAVVDAADRAYLRQRGPSPGEEPCRSRRLQDYLDSRRFVGLPFDIPHVRHLLRIRPDYPYTNAERRYLSRWDHLWVHPPFARYLRRHAADIAGMDPEGRFPEMPHLVVWVTRRLEFHRRHLGPHVEVRPSELTADQVLELWETIGTDAEDAGQIMGGYGDAGFYIENVDTHGARVVVRLRTQRSDATQWFRDRYGAAVDVVVNDPRWECTSVAF
jgi:hypothetical protein